MRVCLYEDRRVLDLEPLTLTRPAFELLCGCVSLGEKQYRAFSAARRGAAVRPHLAALARQTNPDLRVNDRAWLASGPVVLVSSAYKGERNIMTMGWHMMMDYELFGCFIWDQNHSFEMIRRSRECVINIPEVHLLDTAVRIGNSTGAEIDKFIEFGLTALPAKKVKAPLIAECYANFECQLVDTSLSNKYSLFVLKVVKAQAAISPKFPQTIHYRGNGLFMISGPTVSTYRKLFKPEHL